MSSFPAATRERTIAAVAAARAVLAVVAAAAFDALLPDYDASAPLSSAAAQSTATRWTLASPWHALLRWDAVYFLDIAQHGYTFEQAHAFFPALPLAARACAAALTAALPSALAASAASSTWTLGCGILLSNAAFVLAAVLLYRLSRTVLQDEARAAAAALLFVCTPAGLFMSSLYTESLFAALAFGGMLLREHRRLWASAVAFAVAGLVRSNGLLLAGFFVYDAALAVLQRLVKHPGLRRWLPARDDRRSLAWTLLRAVALVTITAAGFLSIHGWAYTAYCVPSPLRPWCTARPPMIYSFVQDHYWNVGFLRYYQWKQLPNFLLAAPTLVVTGLGLRAYGQQLRKAWDSPTDPQAPIAVGDGVLASQKQVLLRQLPYMALWGFLAVHSALFVHIQIVTRLFTSLPCLYWAVAGWYTSGHWTAKAWTVYSVTYALITAVLFANFYPPA